MLRATDREASQPTVSVVIPAYNAAPFIERAIRSALDQSHEVAEVIVVDDASTDSTTQIIGRLAEEDERVKLLCLPVNGGPSRARNAGFAAATGDWIAVLDADDAYLPDRLSHLMTKSDEADILADNLLSYDPATDVRSEQFGRKAEGWESVDLLSFADARRKHHDFGLFQPVFRRRFLEKHKLRYPEDVRHGEDFLLAFEAIARGARYWLSWRPGYLYTERNSGWSRTLVDYVAMGDKVEALAKRDDLQLSPAIRAKLADRVARISYLDARHRLISAFREKRIGDLFRLAARHPRLWPLIGERLFLYIAKSAGLAGQRGERSVSG